MQSAHYVDLADGAVTKGSGAPLDLRQVHLVGAILAGLALEGAETAAVRAEIRRVDVGVDDEVGPIAVLALPHHRRHPPYRQDVGRAEEPYQFLA